MKTKVCLELKDGPFGGSFGTIKLTQQGKDSFTVTYGLEVKSKLDYNRAAEMLGSSIMHALSCEGLVDNRKKGER